MQGKKLDGKRRFHSFYTLKLQFYMDKHNSSESFPKIFFDFPSKCKMYFFLGIFGSWAINYVTCIVLLHVKLDRNYENKSKNRTIEAGSIEYSAKLNPVESVN